MFVGRKALLGLEELQRHWHHLKRPIVDLWALQILGSHFENHQNLRACPSNTSITSARKGYDQQNGML